MRTRDEAWVALDKTFKSLMDCIEELTEEELTQIPVAEAWTVKDVIAHLWSWVDEAIHTAKAWQEPRPWQEGVTFDDAWNQARVADRSALPLISVMDGLTRAHRRLLHRLDIATDEELKQVGKSPWGAEVTLIDFFVEMASHYTEHAESLGIYRDGCLEDCD